MHYYTFNIGDYAGHTKGLSLIEDLAYRRLLDEYYMRERPLNGCSTTVARMIGMRDQQSEVDYVLRTFFVLNDDKEWVNSRADREIEHYKAKLHKASMAGKASAERRLNGRSVDAERMLNVCSTDVQLTNNQEPITNKQQKNKKEKILRTKICKPDSVDQQMWDDWLVIRKQKRAPLTQTAWDLMLREVDRAGYSIDGAIRECCSRNWAGFRDDWIKNATRTSTQPQNNRRSIHDERADTIRQLTGRHREPAVEIIDIGPDPGGLDRAPF